jgi:hypothetical protein
VQDGSGTTLLHGVPTRVEPATNNVPLGADSIEADGVGPWPDDDAGGLHRDLAVPGDGPSSPGFTTPCDAVPALGSIGAVGLGVAGLLLPGYLGFWSPPVN